MRTRQQLVASRSKTYGDGNTRRFITVHETANRTPGAGAAAHANLQSRGNVREASWHWQADAVEAVQSYPHTVRCWHAGDGRGPGAYSSIAIEICVNSDGDVMQAYRNAAELVRRIMVEENIPLTNVVQHNRWSGKNCPTGLRDGRYGMRWAEFIGLVSAGATPVSNPVPVPKPTPQPAQKDVIQMLPNVDWRSQNASHNEMDERIQGLLKAAECYSGDIDGLRGPKSQAGLAAFQRATNSGDGRGGADLMIGSKTWQSLLLGKRW